MLTTISEVLFDRLNIHITTLRSLERMVTEDEVEAV